MTVALPEPFTEKDFAEAELELALSAALERLSTFIDSWELRQQVKRRCVDGYDELTNRCDQLSSFNAKRAYELHAEGGRVLVGLIRDIDDKPTMLPVEGEEWDEYVERNQDEVSWQTERCKACLRELDRIHRLVTEELAK